jgi:hypothetical protein
MQPLRPSARCAGSGVVARLELKRLVVLPARAAPWSGLSSAGDPARLIAVKDLVEVLLVASPRAGFRSKLF